MLANELALIHFSTFSNIVCICQLRTRLCCSHAHFWRGRFERTLFCILHHSARPSLQLCPRSYDWVLLLKAKRRGRRPLVFFLFLKGCACKHIRRNVLFAHKLTKSVEGMMY